MPQGIRGGYPTHWTVQGNGSREALLIHCSLAKSTAWDGLAGHLAADLRMTAFDIPGHGQSGNWDGRGDIQAVAVAMAGDLISGKADLIGHSFGAIVALRLALEHPEKIRSLTMIEPVFFAASRALSGPGNAANDSEYRIFSAMVTSGDDLGATIRFTDIWGVGTRWSDVPQKQRDYMVDRIGLVIEAAPQIQFDEAGLLGRLDQLKMPVLVIDGENSPPVMREVSAGIRERNGAIRQVRIKGAGHMAPVSHPAEVAAAISQFLRLPDQPRINDKN